MTKHLIKFSPALIGVLMVASLSTSAHAVTLSLNPTADTYLRGGSADQAFGATQSILAGNHGTVGPFAILFRFDLSTLPTSGITIDSVALTLTSTASGAGTLVTLMAFQLSAANADWIEGSQAGTNGINGSATHNFKARYEGNGTNQNWAGTAGARTAGTDYVNTSLASFTGDAATIGTGTLGFTSTGAFQTTVGGAAGGDLNLWVGTPTVVAVNDFFRIASRETAGTASDPLLTINYTVIPEPSIHALAGAAVLALLSFRRSRR